MRIGFQAVMFIIILNLVTGLMYTLSVPGTGQSNILAGGPTAENITERFNASAFHEPETSTLITFVGHIWSALTTMWVAIRFVIAGFPAMLWQIGTQIEDPVTKVAFTSIAGVLFAVFSVVIFVWVFQLLTGRDVER